MAHKRFRKKVSIRTVANALHGRGYYFRELREKPILTPDDVKERYDFAKRFRHKSAAWWLRHAHLHWGNKCFKVATTHKGRKLLARRKVRGVYRTRGKSLRPELVRQNPKLRWKRTWQHNLEQALKPREHEEDLQTQPGSEHEAQGARGRRQGALRPWDAAPCNAAAFSY